MSTIRLGTVVQITGLGSSTGLNGKHGRITGLQGERIVVQVQGEGLKAVREGNLRLVRPQRSWCHVCKSGVMSNVTWTGELECRTCGGNFVEGVRSENEFNIARNFSPPPPRPLDFLGMGIMPMGMGMGMGMGMMMDEDRILDMLHREHQPEVPPPTSAEVLRNLPSVVTTEEHHEAVCPVCQDNFVSGETGTELPCGHLFHKDCITPWLEAKNSCPTCRHELPTDDAEYNKTHLGHAHVG
eukprot:TRINITY_DN3164_c0_g1_i1.p1 TRINITY_DN3164_c0_g1~~TRINITY_DN3164_c0_g1_i1.p1  ORF type:complete len:260 (+),score=62.01 TRINITY_DN3164_c0_g1_i1:60-782(+)